LPITSASPFTGAVARDAAGTIWLGTTRGLVCVRSGVVSAVNLTRGATRIDVLVADREENLWIGTEAGLFRLPPERVAWFPSGQQTFGPVVEGSDGRIYVSADHGILELTSGTSAAVPGSTAQPFRRLRNFMCDSRGDWWIGTAGGLYRFRGPRLQFRDGRRFGPEDGLPRTGIVDAGSLHEDAQGLVWVSCAEGVYRYDPSRRRPPFFERVPMPDAAPTIAIGHDPSGVVWLTSYNRTLRVVGDRLSEVHSAPGLPATELADVQARAFLEDSRGWFWIGLRHDGVSVTREPRVAEPRFVNYSSRNGLGSDVVWSVAEDAYGRMYFATSSGLVRFDVSASRFEQLTAADGLPADTFYSCLRDRRGDVWAGAWNGVARLSPLSPGAIAISPAVYLQRLRIAGEDVRLPERGTLVVPPLTLAPGRNNALIEYGGVRLGGGGPLRYRYRLEGADNDWGAPVSETAVSYARLAPGSYRFLVRAVAPDGRESPEAASVAFRILPPLWRRGWFMALTALATILAATAVQRLRIARAVAMERVRRQIATDLHDDVGSGLAQIAVLSEVARRDAPSGVGDRMAAVAGLARTLRESMGDIVWAVDPRRDRLTDVVRRMRQTAFDLAEADGIRVDFALPDEGEIESLVLPPDHKRQVYLVFKESMTNVVRHAGARNVRVTLEAGRSLLTLTIEDDGSGFDSEASHAGLGIASLRRRAEQLRGRLEILSAPGRGVKVRLEVPLGGWLRRRGGDDRA
jgi:signal transduction histidine kinase/streptogramin lyase